MTTKCIGIMGLIFGHKWRMLIQMHDCRDFNNITGRWEWGIRHSIEYKCERCGAVTGEKK